MTIRKILVPIILIYLGLVFLVIRSHHIAPLSDDLSMIAFSKSWSWDWLNKGLADYFIVYPEYYGPQSNFIRPVSNFVYWIFSALFPADHPVLANQMQLLILTFGMLITFAGLVGVLLLKVQESRLIAALGCLACVFIPTFWTTPSPTYTSFVFDGLAITFCLLALSAVERSRFAAMSILLALALMTKEIAFPVILGFTLASLFTRNWRMLAGCGIAIAVFLALRINGFGLHAQGVYVFESTMTAFSDLVMDKLRNIFTLPFGPVFYDEVFTQSGFNFLNRSDALLLINFVTYGIIASLAWRLKSRLKLNSVLDAIFSRTPLDMRVLLVMVSALAAMISFAFDAYVGANYRYAFNFLPFLFIALAGLNIPALAKKAFFSIFLIASLVASAPSIARFIEGSEYETFRYQVVRDFFEKVRTHRESNSIVVLNDFVLAYANPRAVEILAPTQSKIVRGTSLYLDNCSMNDLAKIETRIEQSGSETRMTVTLPECGRFAFESSPKLPEFVTGNMIRRNDHIHYEFTPVAASRHASVPGWNGRNLTSVTRGSDLVYFDFRDMAWKFIASRSN